MTNANELTSGCVVCGPADATKHRVPEARLRNGEEFDYAECANCGSLQIVEVPADLSPYYSTDNYYSFAARGRTQDRRLQLPGVRHALSLAGLIYERTGRGPGIPWTRSVGMRRTDRILDVGCGGGQLLEKMQLLGFRHLAGVDPFLDGDRTVGRDIPLRHQDIGQARGVYDWVMLHHVFEHVANPRATLREAGRLAPNGRVLIRMPIMGKHAWRTYGPNWVQIDAPRHLIVLTEEATRRLAAEEGFKVDQVIYDSTDLQFVGSELVKAGESHTPGPKRSALTSEHGARWAAAARELNAAGDGDQAVIVLSPLRDAD